MTLGDFVDPVLYNTNLKINQVKGEIIIEFGSLMESYKCHQLINHEKKVSMLIKTNIN